jgi:RNA polymerase sigma-70 factor (ECF subfamily)
MKGGVTPYYERYARLVLNRARELLGDGDAAKDALQEVFLRALTCETCVLGEPSLVPWLYRVTTNLCLNQLRDDRRRKQLLLERDEVGADTGAGSPETRTIASDVLRRLPSDLQQIAVYRFVQEMTHEEIADLVGVSPRTVGNRLLAFQPTGSGQSSSTTLKRRFAA